MPGSSGVAKTLSHFRLCLVESHTQLLRQLDQKIREMEKARGLGNGQGRLANEGVAAVQQRNTLTDSFLGSILTPKVLCSIHCDVSKHTKDHKGRYMRWHTEAMAHLEVHGTDDLVDGFTGLSEFSYTLSTCSWIIRIHELGFLSIFPKEYDKGLISIP